MTGIELNTSTRWPGRRRRGEAAARGRRDGCVRPARGSGPGSPPPPTRCQRTRRSPRASCATATTSEPCGPGICEQRGHQDGIARVIGGREPRRVGARMGVNGEDGKAAVARRSHKPVERDRVDADAVWPPDGVCFFGQNRHLAGQQSGCPKPLGQDDSGGLDVRSRAQSSMKGRHSDFRTRSFIAPSSVLPEKTRSDAAHEIPQRADAGLPCPGARCQENRCQSFRALSMQVARGSVPEAVLTAGWTQNMSGCASGKGRRQLHQQVNPPAGSRRGADSRR